ncbi:Rid family hydrolase [Nocardioides sp. MAHUQ-72]|uniref:Rid family hydrolase n=1 Tax=unclassified Nocardioides TaxID=2615069 RepID=UPI0036164740
MSDHDRRAVHTDAAPPPAGPYSQAITAGGLVFLAGQTPRTPAGERLLDRPLADQVRRTMENLRAVAEAARCSLHDAVKVNVFVRPGVDMAVVNAIYAEYFSDPLPARTTTVSDLAVGAIEVDAILVPAATS